MPSELAASNKELSDPVRDLLDDFGKPDPLGISVVMPCLNEERSVGICVRKAWDGISSSGLSGEVIVVDNGSTDGSVAAAKAAGARVLHQPQRGYGNAYLTGFSAARGRIVVMGDSDDSYDFTVIPELIKPIDEGFDYVLGSRFAGQIRPEAMTWSHRRIGNPVLTTTLNLLFGLRVSDAHSGFRALTRVALEGLELQSEGMELASEIVVKAARANLRTAEIPIIYHPRIGVSKLNSLSDGWRHLRFLLMFSPNFLFIGPGISLVALGFLGQLALLGLAGSRSVLFAKVSLALLALVGTQLLTLGLVADTVAGELIHGKRRRAFERVRQTFTLERGLLLGAALAVIGLAVTAGQLIGGVSELARGGLSTSVMVLGLGTCVLGAQIWFDAFFVNLMLLRPRSSRGASYREFVVTPTEQSLTPASEVAAT